MGRSFVIIVIIMAMLATLALTFLISNFTSKFTGLAVGDTYLENVRLDDCVDTIKWDLEDSDFKLTVCPDTHPIMNGVGIGVNNDSLNGGRARCCKSKHVDVYDCQEEGLWEEGAQDYKMTICPNDRPIMKGIGVKVENGNQAGGKVLCCKTNAELYGCAITSYWQNSNKDFRLTYCPEDKVILGGTGFAVKDHHQQGGKVYCCSGRVMLTVGEEVQVETGTEEAVGDEGVEEEVNVVGEIKDEAIEDVKDAIEGAEEGGVCGFMRKVFC